MRPIAFSLTFALALAASPIAALAQTSGPSTDRIIRMNGALPVVLGAKAATTEPVEFSIYDQETGGRLLWQETQVLTVDANGAFAVYLGASSDGLPVELFAGGAARWLSVQRPGGPAAARTLLTAVPYAVSAANAETLGGRPAADYLLTPAARRNAATDNSDTSGADVDRDPIPQVNNGTANYIGKFFNNVDLINSSLYDAGGTIGLNTTTPFDIFHSRFTNAGGTQTGLAVQNLSSAANAYSGMLFYDHTGALRQFQGYNNSTGEYRINNISPSATINFMTGSTSRFKVATSGDIGLNSGTNTPVQRLENFGVSQSDVTFISRRHGGTISSPTATGNGANLFRFEGAGHNGTAFTSEKGFLQIISTEAWTPTANGTEINFATTTNGTTVSATRMTIANDGNVGIGTASPDVTLEVTCDVRATGGSFQPLDTGSWGMRWVTTAGALRAHIHRFVLDDRLYVTNNGGANLTGVYLASGATSWTSTSDERLKRNITPLSGLLGKIKGIRVAAYDMATVSAGTDGPQVDMSTTRHEVGSIAQDWLKDFPELVVKPKAPGQFYGLDYDRIGVVALGAVQELHTVVEQKDAEIKSLTERIAALEAMLKALTATTAQQR